MAYALRFDGVNDYADTTIWTPTSNDWVFEIKFILDSLGVSNHVVISNGRHTNGIYFNYNPTDSFLWCDNQSISCGLLTTGVEYTAKLVSVGGSVQYYFDGVLIGTRTAAITPSHGFNFGRRVENGSSYANVSIISCELTDDNDSLNSRFYSADDSDHSNTGVQPVLVDTIAGNDATGVGMPTDGSAWIDLGGGSIEITPSAINSSSVSLNPTIQFKSIVDLTPNAVNSSSISLDPTVSFESVLNIEPNTVNSASVGLNPTIEFASVVNVTPESINSLSVANNPTITFSSVLNVAPNSINSSSVSNDPTIEFTSAVNITPNVINSSSVSRDPIVEFKSVINLTPNVVNSSSVSLNPTVLFASQLQVAPNTVNSNSIALNPTVEFKSVISVAPNSVNSNSVSLNPEVKFISEINLSPSTINSSSVAKRPTIVIGEIDEIIDWTVSYKDNGISVGYKLNDISVKYKSNDITVSYK